MISGLLFFYVLYIFFYYDTLTGGCLLWDSLGVYLSGCINTRAKLTQNKHLPVGGVYRGGVEIVRKRLKNEQNAQTGAHLCTLDNRSNGPQLKKSRPIVLYISVHNTHLRALYPPY